MTLDEQNLPEKIGNYQIKKLIGKGGMGEIFLAEDPICERQVALKRILSKLIHYPTIRKRFISEAKIAAQLAHPSIISIYSLHEEEKEIYYTMPYIEGDTLKEILKLTREREREGEAPHPIGGSIPTLIRIFLNVCQAVHYTHSKGFLHRDLKPENIMVGSFGEVIILDWGIALPIGKEEDEDPSINSVSSHDLTKPGKVVGTLGYMAPERALKHPASTKTDIYSLGVILYQLLSLKLPFIRPSLQEFRKQMKHERWVEPQEIAPHRDIPSQLSQITKKCLHPDPNKRYDSVHDLIIQLENYIEGLPEWIPTTSLDIHQNKDWEFQENVLLAKHMAVSRISNVMEWVMLMISKESFSGNMRMEAQIEITEGCSGVGFLLCIPEPHERKSLEDGYCLWIGSQKDPGCTLFKSNVEVMHIPDVMLSPNTSSKICIEKIDNRFHLSIDNAPILNYVSHIPLMNGHLGVLSRDANFKIDPLDICLGSQNIMVNCLSVPDAFLTNKDYHKALAEYRRIAHSFKGRSEGREALFRAGITLLEQAKEKKTKEKKQELFSKALSEFENLHGTPGAPLEYLGKSLVYQVEGEIEEEIKCLELAIRKFPKHPLLPVLEEHIGFRLHETARNDRRAAYSFTLLSLLHVPHVLHSRETEHLIQNLTTDWESLDFIETPKQFSNDKTYVYHIAIQLAFWLAKPTTIYEILQKIPREAPEHLVLIQNALFSLLELGAFELTQYILEKQLQDNEFNPLRKYLKVVLETQDKPIYECLEHFFQIAPKHFSNFEIQVLKLVLGKGLKVHKAKELLPFLDRLQAEKLKPVKIWTYLLSKQEEVARTLLPSGPIEIISPYYPLKLCLKDNHDSLLELKHPPSTALLGYFLKGLIKPKSSWIKRAFSWEKIQFFKQLSLYYLCNNDQKKALSFEQIAEDEKLKINSQSTSLFN